MKLQALLFVVALVVSGCAQAQKEVVTTAPAITMEAKCGPGEVVVEQFFQTFEAAQRLLDKRGIRMSIEEVGEADTQRFLETLNPVPPVSNYVADTMFVISYDNRPNFVIVQLRVGQCLTRVFSMERDSYEYFLNGGSDPASGDTPTGYAI